VMKIPSPLFTLFSYPSIPRALQFSNSSKIHNHNCLFGAVHTESIESSIEVISFALTPKGCDADAEGRGGIFQRWRQRQHATDVLLLVLLERNLLRHTSLTRGARMKKNVWQIFFAQRSAAAQHDCALDGVAQFADIARPWIGDQSFASFVRELQSDAPITSGGLGEKHFGERQNVFGSFAQCGHAQVDNV